MKILLSILFSVLFLASCTNDKSNVIVNVNIIGENSDSIQNLIKDAVNNDSARVVNINVYNNVTVESDNKTKVETPVLETANDTLSKVNNDLFKRMNFGNKQ